MKLKITQQKVPLKNSVVIDLLTEGGKDFDYIIGSIIDTVNVFKK